MPLNAMQRQRLIEHINNMKLDNILPYFLNGEIELNDVPHILPDRKAYIESRLPSPAQIAWDALQPSIQQSAPDLLRRLDAYIQNWENQNVPGNHMEEARGLKQRILDQQRENERKRQMEEQQRLEEERRRQEHEAAMREESDWGQVNHLSCDSLLRHLQRYPHSVHSGEIDEMFWNQMRKDQMMDLDLYLAKFPQGLYSREAEGRKKALYDWCEAKNANDLEIMWDYVRIHPDSPFLKEAKMEIVSLKQREIQDMHNRINKYDRFRLKKLVDAGIFTSAELIGENIVTQHVLEKLMSDYLDNDLPDINQAISDSVPECKKGFTDIYFFGIPSTGKTCVLMGLSRTPSLSINLAAGGGCYAEALMQYIDEGCVVGRTPGDFVTTLEATINDGKDGEHKVNLVEMSGEEFAFGIVNNPNRAYSFEDMGTGVTNLLKNDNGKTFFIIIDPTVTRVTIQREKITYDEESGRPIKTIEEARSNQSLTIQKLLNIFADPVNSDIMKKVDSIHFIMTKADTMGTPLERRDKAREVFQNNYSALMEPFLSLCRHYNINRNNGYRPNLYTFSLGDFYIGGYYEYDATDSENLVNAIKNATSPIRRESFWGRLGKLIN